MWTFTKYGFYSATRSRTEPDKMQIRGRARADLEKLQRFAIENGINQDPGLASILHTPHADYHYRLIVRPETWTALITALAVDVTYPNFKNTITDPARHSAYTRIWSVMFQVQEDEAFLQSDQQTFGYTWTDDYDQDSYMASTGLEGIEEEDGKFESDVRTMSAETLSAVYGVSLWTAQNWKKLHEVGK